VPEVAICGAAPADGLLYGHASEAERRGMAVGSTALADALTDDPRPWRVMGVSTHVLWCSADDAALVITDDRVVRLPNSVTAGPGFTIAARSLSPGDEIIIGDGVVATRTGGWRIGRWWDPRVAPIATDLSAVIGLVRSAARLLPLDDEAPLITALGASDPDRVVEQAGRLIGSGEGLTPEGDDFLTGAVAGYGHSGASVGNVAAATVIEQIRLPLLAAARRSTTLLSFSLLHHAFNCEVAVPLGALLRALAGRGDVAAALAATTVIGHRSGPALARGVVGGAAAACGVTL